MARTPFDRLMMTVRPHLPGAVDEAIRQELFLVCQEFFSMSDCWREDIDFTLAAGAKTADLMPYTGRIERLLYVTQGGRPVRGAYLGEGGTIHMPYAASTVSPYVATVSLTVSDPITRDAYPIVPYDLTQKHTQTLVHGLLKNMMAQPSKPYTNIGLAQYNLSKFKGGYQRARNEANSGHTQGSQRWAFPQTHANR